MDVARLAGVSQATVSRVMSGNASVTEETRDRVLVAARQLGYRSNALAQGLRSGRTRTIGMVWPSSIGQRSDAVVHEFAARMEAQGYMVASMEAPGGMDVLPSSLASLAQRRVEAVVMMVRSRLRGPSLAMRELKLFPAVTLVSEYDLAGCGLQADTIHHDRRAATLQVAEHFARIGRRRIGAVMPIQSSQGKLEGLRAGLARHGLELAEERMVKLPNLFPRSNVAEMVWQALDEQVDGPLPFDAVLCGNDTTAAAVCKWLRRRGAGVPDDVAVVGFDNDDWGMCLTPELASVERYDQLLVDLLDRIVMSRLADPQRPPVHERLTMEFVWRASAGGQGVGQSAAKA